MYDDNSVFDFAMVMDILPPHSERRWETLLRQTTPPRGIRLTLKRPTLALLTVEAPTEWEAIDRASVWLKSLAADAAPPLSVGLNAQPTNEV
jgi:hypothetical protein